jgi:hypothetical protein
MPRYLSVAGEKEVLLRKVELLQSEVANLNKKLSTTYTTKSYWKSKAENLQAKVNYPDNRNILTVRVDRLLCSM